MSQIKLFGRKGFSLIELLVVIAIIALLLGILGPALAKARRTAKLQTEGTNSRNIIMGHIVYSSANKDRFPGMPSSGTIIATLGSATANAKYYSGKALAAAGAASSDTIGAIGAQAEGVSLEDGSTQPSQWISPGETVSTIVAATPSTTGTALVAATVNVAPLLNNSFATLSYVSTGLTTEWKNNSNSLAVLNSSRIGGTTAAGAGTSFSTVWTDYSSAKFQGVTTRGDASTATDTFADATSVASTYSVLKYGSSAAQATFAATNGVGVCAFNLKTGANCDVVVSATPFFFTSVMLGNDKDTK